MDKNRGAKQKVKTPFTRSGKTTRTPPSSKTPTSKVPVNESSYPCATCFKIDNEPIVRCDKCHLWYHFACINAPENVAEHEWFCPECKLQVLMTTTETIPQSNVEQNVNKPSSDINVPAKNQQSSMPLTVNNVTENQQSSVPVSSEQQLHPPSVRINSSTSHKSKSSSSSSRRRRLALQRLEEERRLELEERKRREKSNLEYLNKKYSILEEEGSDDGLSFDDVEIHPMKFDTIQRWNDNVQIHRNSTEADWLGKQVRIEDLMDFDGDKFGEGIEGDGQQIPFHQTFKPNIHQDQETQQNITVSVAQVDLQTQRGGETNGNNLQQISSDMYSSQQRINNNQWNNQGIYNNKVLVATDPNQGNMGTQTTIQQTYVSLDQPSMASAQVRSQQVYRTQAFVQPNKQPSGETQGQFQQVYRTQAFVHQDPQNSGLNQTFNENPDQYSQTYVPISQPAINLNVNNNSQQQNQLVSNNEQLMGNNQTFTTNNRPAVTIIRSTNLSQPANSNQRVTTHQPIVSSQPIVLNQPPVMSTFVYQQPIVSNMQYQQPAVSNMQYQQPIVSNMHYQQPVVSNHQQQVVSSGMPHQVLRNDQAYTNNQSVFASMSVPYIHQQPIYGNSFTGGILNANGSHQQDGNVTMQNLMSRQVIDKKLPIFTGNPMEWFAWYNRYVSTTAKCNLDNCENLDRLTKCLKGKAYDIVKSKLSQPEAVPWIISTLQKVFGRPETVLKAVIHRISDIPPIKNDNLKQMMEFAFEVQSIDTTIESSGLINQYSNPMLLEDLVKKLPSNVKLDWAKYKRGLRVVNVKTFTQWLETLADDISTVVEPAVEQQNYNNKKTDKSVKSDKTNEKETAHTWMVHRDGGSRNKESESSKNSRKSSPCITCGKNCQKVENCPKFNNLSIEKRWEVTKEQNLCRLCFKRHKPPCKSSNVCGKDGCSYKHHKLLHNDERYSEKQIQKPIGTEAGNNNHYDPSTQVMLKYALVTLYNNNKKIKTIAFFDDGSQASMMEQRLANELGVSGTKENLCLLWTDNIHRKEEAQRVSIEISGDDLNRRFPLNGIRAVSSLHLPAQTFKKEDFIKKYPYLSDLPVKDYEKAIPGILIGSDFPKLGVQLKVIEGKGFKSPIASKTRLGWMVYGPCGEQASGNYVNTHQVIQICTHHNQLDDEIHKQVKEFFSIENFGVRASSKSEMESKDNKRAIELLQKLTRKVDGRYETGLLWKQDNINKTLPDSYPMAMKRLISLEKQGEKVVKVIGDKIAEYVSKGYARKLSEKEVKELGNDVWYLPVFGVVHPKKPEKLRMVFDGAAKVKSVSLNSTLLTGPDELASLVDILRRLREKLVAVGGDVKEMYHQVRMREEDQRYQLFLFRNGESIRKPDVYAMCVMTFGSRCSPAAAQYVKNTNAKQFEKTHPRAVQAIIQNHYVDDMMDGDNTVDEAIKLAQDVKMIHAKGGFEIRNFISNSLEVLKALGANECDEIEITLDSEMKTERVLGMWWNTRKDVFTFSLKYTLIAKEILDGTKLPTKRELLRTLMSIFDPLGLLSNYLIQLKILLQDVWRIDLKWDEQIQTKGLVSKWKQWLDVLPAVENVQIPRFYSFKLVSGKPKSIQIHTFVDASIDAFSAATYIRIENEDGVDCALVGSKARVAPLKYLSIPRKELQSAILGTRLMSSIIEAQRFKIDRRVLWSDSETVLSWLKSDHRKYSQFVAHRVGEILESTDVNEWRWISTKNNVADEATKWSKSINFKSSNRWFAGPDFLRLSENNWPKKKIIKPDVEEEMKAHCVHASLVLPELVNAERFSNWNRMVRAVAYSIRFRKVFTDKTCKGTPLSQEEITKAEDLIFRQAQFEGYPSEMVILERNKSRPLSKQKYIEKPSPLYDGTPYLDADGILRMKTRIDGARDLSLHTKRPIILPRDSRITRLLVHHYHVKYFHQNHQTVINEIRQRFYIPRLQAVLQKVRKYCQMCKVKKPKTMKPQMADLPPARLATFTKPFSYVGLDFFGPMKVKIGRRNEKRWGVLYTCLTIRAVHIDLVSSLDTNSCIKSIGNFIADRGQVIEFHSDNGTNFTGADNELKKELEKLDPEKLKTEFTSRYTNWVFNPPSAPHMGGAWERLIASVKSGVYFALPTRTPTEETLRNLLKEIQNIVNSRPLTYVPLEVEEDEALTPNHFLYGSSNGMKPPCEIDIEGEYLRQSWKEAQRLTELFWIRFIKEYLPTLTRRTKWFKKIKPLSPNDLVLVVDEKNPRNTYPRAKVLETRIGSNGQVRRAKIQLIAEAKTDLNGKICKVRKTELWRPAHKLAVLDVLINEVTNPEEDRAGDKMALVGADGVIRNQDISLATHDSSVNGNLEEVEMRTRTNEIQGCETGGSVTITNDNTGPRRSARNLKGSGNTRN